jgi:hypothetical protein
MIPTIAWSDMHDAVVRSVRTVIAAIDMKAGRVQVGKLGAETQALRGVSGDETIEGRDPIGVEGLQAPPEHVIIEVSRRNPRPYETLSWFVLKKARHQLGTR